MRNIDAVVGLRVNDLIEKGQNPPYEITVSKSEWHRLNDGVFYETTMECGIKWNDNVIILNPLSIDEMAERAGIL